MPRVAPRVASNTPPPWANRPARCPCPFVVLASRRRARDTLDRAFPRDRLFAAESAREKAPSAKPSRSRGCRVSGARAARRGRRASQSSASRSCGFRARPGRKLFRCGANAPAAIRRFGYFPAVRVYPPLLLAGRRRRTARSRAREPRMRMKYRAWRARGRSASARAACRGGARTPGDHHRSRRRQKRRRPASEQWRGRFHSDDRGVLL